MKCIQIFRDGKMDELNIPKTTIINNLTQASNSQGNNELTKIYQWQFEGDIITCFGWYDGDKGFENLHDLPYGGESSFLEEDSSEKLFYGDIFILKYREGKPMDITISDYSVFYSDRFDNFSDYGSDNDDVCENTELQESDVLIYEEEEVVTITPDSADLECDTYDY
jgi:hypothetical protein